MDQIHVAFTTDSIYPMQFTFSQSFSPQLLVSRQWIGARRAFFPLLAFFLPLDLFWKAPPVCLIAFSDAHSPSPAAKCETHWPVSRSLGHAGRTLSWLLWICRLDFCRIQVHFAIYYLIVKICRPTARTFLDFGWQLPDCWLLFGVVWAWWSVHLWFSCMHPARSWRHRSPPCASVWYCQQALANLRLRSWYFCRHRSSL